MKVSDDRKALYFRCPTCNSYHEVVYDERRKCTSIIHVSLKDEVVSSDPDYLGDVCGIMDPGGSMTFVLYPVALNRVPDWYTDAAAALIQLLCVLRDSAEALRPHMRTIEQTGMHHLLTPEQIDAIVIPAAPPAKESLN